MSSEAKRSGDGIYIFMFLHVYIHSFASQMYLINLAKKCLMSVYLTQKYTCINQQ